MKNIFNNIEIKDNYILFHKYGDGWSSTSRWEISDFIIFIIIIALLTALLVWFAVSYIKYLRKRNNSKKTLDYPVAPSKIYTVNAKVIAKYTEMEKHGGRTYSNHRIIYRAEFLADNGKVIKCEIPQELYDSLTEQQAGTLAISEGRFFYFGDGEPIK